ncbi:MAG: YhcH/YjgK/YiaL family protein [Tepidisphaeraceae bacterium]
MVFDRLAHASLYEGMARHIRHAFEFLRRSDLDTLAVGKYAIVGEDAYALVQSYQTKPAEQAKWETHRRYIDVQFVASGVERMGYGHLADFQPINGYNEAGDYQLYTGSGSDIVMTPGTFAIFSPHDVHRPTGAVEQPILVRKVVIKVRVD